jgi:hypothetical protein
LIDLLSLPPVLLYNQNLYLGSRLIHGIILSAFPGSKGVIERIPLIAPYSTYISHTYFFHREKKGISSRYLGWMFYNASCAQMGFNLGTNNIIALCNIIELVMDLIA